MTLEELKEAFKSPELKDFYLIKLNDNTYRGCYNTYEIFDLEKNKIRFLDFGKRKIYRYDKMTFYELVKLMKDKITYIK